MITVLNEQKKIDLKVQFVEMIATLMLDCLHAKDVDLGIKLVDNAQIQTLNKRYRLKDEPTDILSFHSYPDAKPEEMIEFIKVNSCDLGDLVISLERASSDALDLGETLEQRVVKLLAHGICHLLGHRHETFEQDKLMKILEADLENCTKSLKKMSFKSQGDFS